MDALGWDRLQFGFTIAFHYLFPQLTMGLALVLVVLKVRALRGDEPAYDDLVRFWGRIFAINFALGVVTGIPMGSVRRRPHLRSDHDPARRRARGRPALTYARRHQKV